MCAGRLIGFIATVWATTLMTTAVAETAGERRENLLTLANGAIVVRASANPGAALDLINGDPKDRGWNNQTPKNALPYEFVFELLAPTVVREVGIVTAAGRTAGGVGTAAKTIDVAGSASGPDDSFTPLGTLEVAGKSEASLTVADPKPVRWLRFTVRANHGNAIWTYLSEVMAYGDQQPVPDDDGRYTGSWESNFGPIELVQTGTELAGCFVSGRLFGSVSGGVARVGWQDRLSPKVHGTALFVVDARKNLEGVRYRPPSRARWGGPAAGRRLQTDCTKVPLPANPLGAAFAARGAVELYGIHFDFDAAVLQPRSEPVLRQLAEALGAQETFPVEVEGHTDAVGAADYNRDLSQRRAEAVVAWLAAHGIDRARLQAVGRGATEPVASNDTADGRALNRRVTVVKRPPS